MIYDELIEELALTLLTKARYTKLFIQYAVVIFVESYLLRRIL